MNSAPNRRRGWDLLSRTYIPTERRDAITRDKKLFFVSRRSSLCLAVHRVVCIVRRVPRIRHLRSATGVSASLVSTDDAVAHFFFFVVLLFFLLAVLSFALLVFVFFGPDVIDALKSLIMIVNALASAALTWRSRKA